MEFVKRSKKDRDLPSIPLADGRFLFDYSRDEWRRRWEEVFQYEVLHWRVSQGVRLNLEMLIMAAHPGLKGDKRGRALFANDFLWKLREERRRARAETAQRRQDTNGGGT